MGLCLTFSLPAFGLCHSPLNRRPLVLSISCMDKEREWRWIARLRALLATKLTIHGGDAKSVVLDLHTFGMFPISVT